MVEFSPFFGIILVTAPMLPDTRPDDDERKSGFCVSAIDEIQIMMYDNRR